MLINRQHSPIANGDGVVEIPVVRLPQAYMGVYSIIAFKVTSTRWVTWYARHVVDHKILFSGDTWRHGRSNKHSQPIAKCMQSEFMLNC